MKLGGTLFSDHPRYSICYCSNAHGQSMETIKKHVVFVPVYVNVLHVLHMFCGSFEAHGSDIPDSLLEVQVHLNRSIKSGFPINFQTHLNIIYIYIYLCMVVHIPLKYTEIHSDCGQMVFLTSFWSRAQLPKVVTRTPMAACHRAWSSQAGMMMDDGCVKIPCPVRISNDKTCD